MKFDSTELNLKSLKLTRGLQKTFFLNGLWWSDLQPLAGTGEVKFCLAWSKLMGVEFDAKKESCEDFYKHFDFDFSEPKFAIALTYLIADLVARDIEPVKALDGKRSKKS